MNYKNIQTAEHKRDNNKIHEHICYIILPFYVIRRYNYCMYLIFCSLHKLDIFVVFISFKLKQTVLVIYLIYNIKWPLFQNCLLQANYLRGLLFEEGAAIEIRFLRF